MSLTGRGAFIHIWLSSVCNIVRWRFRQSGGGMNVVVNAGVSNPTNKGFDDVAVGEGVVGALDAGDAVLLAMMAGFDPT